MVQIIAKANKVHKLKLVFQLSASIIFTYFHTCHASYTTDLNILEAHKFEASVPTISDSVNLSTF